MTDGSLVQDFFARDQPRKPLFAMYALIILLVSYHALVFTVIKGDDIQTKDGLAPSTLGN